MPSAFSRSAMMMSRKRSTACKRRQQRKEECNSSSSAGRHQEEIQEERFTAETTPGYAQKRRSYRTMSTSSRTTTESGTCSAPILIQREDEETAVGYGYTIVVPLPSNNEPVEEMPETRQFFGESCCMRQLPPSAVATLESFNSLDLERSLPFFGEAGVFIQSPERFQQSCCGGYLDYYPEPLSHTESHQGGVSALVPGTIQRGISTIVDLDELTAPRSNLFHSLERQESR
jgi:hypothetical protein